MTDEAERRPRNIQIYVDALPVPDATSPDNDALCPGHFEFLKSIEKTTTGVPLHRSAGPVNLDNVNEAEVLKSWQVKPLKEIQKQAIA